MDATQQTSSKPSMGGDVQSEPVPVAATPPTQPHEEPAAPYSSTNVVSEAPPTGEALKEINSELPSLPSKSTVLQQQVQILASLQTRMSKIRSLPAHLLIFHSQSPLISFGGLSGLGLGDGDGPSESDTINSILNADAGTETATQARELGSQARVAFRVLSDAKEELVKTLAQSALKAARESEAQDSLDVTLNGRRTRKKRRITIAESPAPFPSFHVETTHVFPPSRPEDRKIEDLDGLISFIRKNNRSKSSPSDQSPRIRLGLWTPSRPQLGTPRHVSDVLTVKLTIRDVTTVFVKLRHPDRDSGNRHLCVESVAAFGPREKKSPYSHSDFTVYQQLTQYIARMVEKEPNVLFSQLVDLLTSYEDLFITHCSVCRRVLPLEGHVPPVARVWKGKECSITADGDRGCWEARHFSCLHA